MIQYKGIETSKGVYYIGSSFSRMSPDELFEIEKEKMRSKLENRKDEINTSLIPFKDNSEYDDIMDATEFISESSKKTYKSRLMFLRKKTGEEFTHNILINPYIFAMFILDSDTEMKSKDNSFVAILAYLAYSGLKADHSILFTLWYSAYMIVFKGLKKLRESNIPTKKQSECMIEWSKVLEIRDKLPYGSDQHLLLSLYTYVPPRRQLDYANMRVYIDSSLEPERNHNYFQLFNKRLNAPVFYIHEYKNAKFFRGFLNKEVPFELVKIVGESLKKKDRDYLFVTKVSKKPFKVQEFTNWSNGELKKIFSNDCFSVNTLRHSFANHLVSLRLTLEERKRYAVKMGHSLAKSLEYVLFHDEKK